MSTRSQRATLVALACSLVAACAEGPSQRPSLDAGGARGDQHVADSAAERASGDGTRSGGDAARGDGLTAADGAADDADDDADDDATRAAADSAASSDVATVRDGAAISDGPVADRGADRGADGPRPTPTAGIWTSATELAARPTSGKAWDALKRDADAPLRAKPNLSARDGEGVQVLARALVYARTGTSRYRDEVVQALRDVIGTEGSDALATFRALSSYIIAADLVGLPAADDSVFRAWLIQLLDPNHKVGTRSLVGCHEDRPNNWGTMAGASRAAAAVYLGDTKQLARTALVFKGWLGDRTAYAGFVYGDLAWQCDPSRPVGINPKGCTKNGHVIDGVIADDQRRTAGGFQWPPPREGYVWESLQGALVQAQILYRAGYDVWRWQDNALLRAVTWLHDEASFPPEGDDEWQSWLINAAYGTTFVTALPARGGKNVGFTDWTHAP